MDISVKKRLELNIAHYIQDTEEKSVLNCINRSIHQYSNLFTVTIFHYFCHVNKLQCVSVILKCV